jgi:NAD(P)-dependent dehydrogenase (short-subunit alcohol dehydrogenase family)
MVQNFKTSKRMEKKIILITGASGGLGLTLSNYFSAQNHRLILCYNNHKPEIAENDHIIHIKADLRKSNQLEKAFQQAVSKWGKIDVLINNAGISKSNMSWKTSLDEWNETMQINLTAPFLFSKLVLPLMKKNAFGRIINISSVVAQTGVIGTSAYAASKSGLIGLTKTMSKEVAKHNITINALALGYFNKGMINDVPDNIKEEIIRTIPKNELGPPVIIAKTIDYLMSSDAHYVTGQTINLNGGLYS